MKKNWILGILAILFTGSASGQFLVKGVVTSSTGENLAGALVNFRGTSVATNPDGTFAFDHVPYGTHTLDVRFIGFENHSETIAVAQNLDLKIVLAERNVYANEVVVSAIKARKTDPVAYSELSKDEITRNNYGQDVPYLLSLTPGMVVSSDAGTGIGYTNLRLRGSDLTRINVTVNGIPLNDAESQGVFWVNMPDFASSVEEVQVQRGVGTSTNGAASFGGSINFGTSSGPDDAEVLIDNSYGSYRTWRNSVSVKTGLLNNHFVFDARLSRLTSDGYVDRASSDLKSFYLSGGYYGRSSSLRFVTFSGKEKTYQAWNGVPKVKLDNDQDGMEELVAMDGWSDEEAANLYNSDARTFNRYLYKNQTDNYQQDHYQLHFSHKTRFNLALNAALHYTKGKGYYESYKYDQKFSKYAFPFDSLQMENGYVKATDLIAQKWLDNDFYGATFSAIYQYDWLHLATGGAINRYDGNHYGDVIWAAVNNGISNSYRWYQSTGTKDDFNWYVKATASATERLSIYADAQYRRVSHELEGTHDDLSDLTRQMSFDFFNPKFGANYKVDDRIRAYASVAVANREPSRNDFRDADISKLPTSERLIDYEAGIEAANHWAAIRVNGFYMAYKDQLVLTGEINNVGSPIMTNVPNSYRKGLEVSGGIKLTGKLNWTANVVLSANKIKDFTEHVDNWSYWDDPDNEPYQYVTALGTTDIAFSPNVTAASRIDFQFAKNWNTALQTRYVGKQYIDNTSDNERMLDAYLVNDWYLNYRTQMKGIATIDLGLQVNNLLSEKYISNAWVYSYYYSSKRGVLDGYFTQAPRNYMVRMALTF
ncbi:MAG: TonB-dependent receptor [Breznakibacter sp.]